VSWLHNSKSLVPLQIQNLKASNEIAKRRLLEYCGSERIYTLPGESTPSRYYGLVCTLCFQDLLRQLEILIYIRTVLVVIVGPYTFESRIHKVAVELPNIVEGLVGVQLCTLYLLQIDGIANTTLASGIVPPCEGTIMRFIFQFVFLHLQLQGFSASASPRNRACVMCNQTLSPCGWGLGTRLLLERTCYYQRRLDTYAAHVIVRWTRSDSARVIACFTFLPQQSRSHVNMAWDQG